MTAKEFYNTIKENKTLEEIMIEFARIKCLEAIRNTRYAAIDIVCKDEIIDTVHAIHNIPNQEVLPEL